MPAKSPSRLRRAQDLGVKIYGAEMCKLGVINNGAELRVQILKAYPQRHICENFSKKELKKIRVFFYIEPTLTPRYALHMYLITIGLKIYPIFNMHL